MTVRAVNPFAAKLARRTLDYFERGVPGVDEIDAALARVILADDQGDVAGAAAARVELAFLDALNRDATA